jgi:hypothetical protein
MNVIISIFMSIGLFAVSLLSLMRIGVLIEDIEGMLYVYLLQTVLIWLVSIVVLYLGKMRLSRIE